MTLNPAVPPADPPAVPPKSSPWLTGGLSALGLAGAVIAAATTPASTLPTAAKLFMIAWLTLSVLVTFRVTPRNFTVGYLGGVLTMLVGWRIAGTYGTEWVTRPLLIAFVAFVAQFLDAVRNDREHGPSSLLGAGDWHLAFLRIVIGFDMVPHFTEKLFAGPGAFRDDVAGFAAFGLPAPAAFVVVAGLCEVGIAIGVGMGLLTRLAAVFATVYFLVATIIGGHFLKGFIWASPGGGWEYPMLMMVFFISFAIRGGGAFSLDRVLDEAGMMPAALRRLAIPRRLGRR